MEIHQVQKLFVHRLGAARRRVAYGLGRAVPQMVPQERTPYRTQRLLDGIDLHHNVRAVAVFLDQTLQASHLPLNPAKPLQIR